MSKYDELCAWADEYLERDTPRDAVPLVRNLAAAIRELEGELAVHRNRDEDINDALRTILGDNIEGMERERIEHIADERDALRADAERYRWLRDRHEYNIAASEIVQKVSGEGWDAAIDRAAREGK